MLTQSVQRKYEEFFESTANNEQLDSKTTVMIQLAAAFILGCYP